MYRFSADRRAVIARGRIVLGVALLAIAGAAAADGYRPYRGNSGYYQSPSRGSDYRGNTQGHRNSYRQPGYGNRGYGNRGHSSYRGNHADSGRAPAARSDYRYGRYYGYFGEHQRQPLYGQPQERQPLYQRDPLRRPGQDYGNNDRRRDPRAGVDRGLRQPEPRGERYRDQRRHDDRRSRTYLGNGYYQRD